MFTEWNYTLNRYQQKCPKNKLFFFFFCMWCQTNAIFGSMLMRKPQRQREEELWHYMTVCKGYVRHLALSIGLVVIVICVSVACCYAKRWNVCHGRNKNDIGSGNLLIRFQTCHSIFPTPLIFEYITKSTISWYLRR